MAIGVSGREQADGSIDAAAVVAGKGLRPWASAVPASSRTIGDRDWANPTTPGDDRGTATPSPPPSASPSDSSAGLVPTLSRHRDLAPPERFEPATFRLEGGCSVH